MNILKKAMLKIAFTVKIGWHCARKGTMWHCFQLARLHLLPQGQGEGTEPTHTFIFGGVWDCWPEISLNSLCKSRHLKGIPREGQIAVSASGMFLCVSPNVGTFTGCLFLVQNIVPSHYSGILSISGFVQTGTICILRLRCFLKLNALLILKISLYS